MEVLQNKLKVLNVAIWLLLIIAILGGDVSSASRRGALPAPYNKGRGVLFHPEGQQYAEIEIPHGLGTERPLIFVTPEPESIEMIPVIITVNTNSLGSFYVESYLINPPTSDLYITFSWRAEREYD